MTMERGDFRMIVQKEFFTKLQAIGAAAALAFGGLATPALAKDKFVYGVPSAISSAIANFVFAQELGYFDAENIELEMVPLSGSSVIIPQLLSGQIQAAGASLEPLVIARQPGKPNFPLRFVYNYLRNSVWEFAVLRDSPIQKVSDLRGSTIGVVSLGSGNVFTTRAILAAAGVPWDSVKIQPVGFGVQALEALRTNQIQMLNLWESAHAALEVAGTPIRRLAYPEEYQGMSSHGFEVTDRLLKENPDLLARFGRAVSKGSVACIANYEGCLKAFWKHYPEQKPKTGSEAEILKNELAIMVPRMENIGYFPPGQPRRWGNYDERDWKLLIKALAAGGEVTDQNIPLDSLYTDALVPEYNRFDEQAVIREGKAWK
jgi:NitT/TauT family transport system substrate-binding protein